MRPNPTEIRRRDTHGIAITWSDGEKSEIPSETLRRHCPCATCRERRGDTSHAHPLTTPARSTKPLSLSIVDSSITEQTALREIWAVGNYALGMSWGDGHNTGIYTFELLRSLARPAETGA